MTLRLPDGTRKQEKLCDGHANEAEAWIQLRRYQTGQFCTPTRLTVAEAFDSSLDRASREKLATFEHYCYFLQSFADTGVKAKPVTDLIPTIARNGSRPTPGIPPAAGDAFAGGAGGTFS